MNNKIFWFIFVTIALILVAIGSFAAREHVQVVKDTTANTVRIEASDKVIERVEGHVLRLESKLDKVIEKLP
jgi:cell division protein FtsL